MQVQLYTKLSKHWHYTLQSGESSSITLQFCTKADPTFAAASVLHAQILLRQEKHKQAHNVLEQALSHNFDIRDSPVYHLAWGGAFPTFFQLSV